MTLNANSINIIQWYGLSSHSCGYCKGNGSSSHGLVAHTMQPQTYQELIDRGWRRSGTYCYKPLMNRTCCPMYTIRSDTTLFTLSKSQKKILKRFQKYLSDGMLTNSGVHFDSPNDNLTLADNIKFNVEHLKDIKEGVNQMAEVVASTSGCKQTVSKGVGVDLTKPQCKKAKLGRLERKKQKLLIQGKILEGSKISNAQKSLDEYFDEEIKQKKHKLSIKTFSAESLTLEQLKQEQLLYSKYQEVVHNDPPNKCELDDFRRFLVDTPLIDKEIPNNPVIDKFGSNHQQYWIDDKLIAVGVIDILPNCVSSVYFFYDPDYADLTLGTYAALREISFVKSLNRYSADLRYYYMGYYIHSCPKMRYKGQYKPSELACPETYRWQPIEKCRPKLDKKHYSRLDDEDGAIDDNQCDREDIEELKILQSNSSYTSASRSGKFASNRRMFETIGRVIGKKSLSHMLVYFNDL